MGMRIKPYEGFVSKAGMFVSLMTLQNSYMAEAINSRNDIAKYGLYQMADAVSACIKYLETNPAEEVISKAEYEARLKTDMVAMLTEIQLEIEELKNEPACCQHYKRGVNRSSDIIQQKIDKLKEQTGEKEW